MGGGAAGAQQCRALSTVGLRGHGALGAWREKPESGQVILPDASLLLDGSDQEAAVPFPPLPLAALDKNSAP